MFRLNYENAVIGNLLNNGTLATTAVLLKSQKDTGSHTKAVAARM